MCGIIGYIGKKQAAPILLNGLSRLEYRGYDSAGLAVRDGDGEIGVVRAKGRLQILAEKTDDGKAMKGCCGIGHTRWATHGEPSETNAHPHISDDAAVVVVHNGIIENYQEIKEKLLKYNYTFYSQTDTEIAVNLIDYYLKKYNDGPLDAIGRAIVRIRGSYALAVMFRDYPGEIYFARKDSPLIIGKGDGEMFLASDVPAILQYTRQVYYIGNQELGRINEDGVIFQNLDQKRIEHELVEVKMDASAAEKGGYEHFMIKEIHEQPKAVRDTVRSVLTESGEIDPMKIGISEEEVRNIRQVYVVGCGSAYHVGMAMQYILEDLTEIPVRVELASEFRYRHLLLDPNDLVIVISQSGETADSLAALRIAKENGIRTMGIVNVIGSSIAREADSVLYTLAGPEIAVATTKAYSAQLAAGYLLSVYMGQVRGKFDKEQAKEYVREILRLPEKMERLLEDKERIQWFAAKHANVKDVFFIGRGIDYAISMEGSLKLKEISYIHCEAYAAGELKHGTISLIENGTIVVGILTQPALYEKTLSNMVETGSRGAYLAGLTFAGNYELEETAKFTVYIPKTDSHFATSLAIIPLQLLAYYLAVSKSLDVDKPRNLAKSVTVE